MTTAKQIALNKHDVTEVLWDLRGSWLLHATTIESLFESISYF